MADKHLRQSALAHLELEARAAKAASEEAGVALGECAHRDLIALRGDPDRKAFRDAAAGVLGLELPLEANTTASRRGITVLWLGPDEWLVAAPDGRAPRLVAGLEEALAGEWFLASDVSHARAVIRLEGERAREVLMKGCSLDLHPRAFAPGRCAQTRLARCPMLLHQLAEEPPAYEVYVPRSFADYAWRWLEDAAGEYRPRVLGGH